MHHFVFRRRIIRIAHTHQMKLYRMSNVNSLRSDNKETPFLFTDHNKKLRAEDSDVCLASTAISGGLRFSVYSFTVTFKVDTFRSVTTGQCINVRHTDSNIDIMIPLIQPANPIPDVDIGVSYQTIWHGPIVSSTIRIFRDLSTVTAGCNTYRFGVNGDLKPPGYGDVLKSVGNVNEFESFSFLRLQFSIELLKLFKLKSSHVATRVYKPARVHDGR
ncbi:hypothetical protein C8Q75DRAFT_732796 [Abortiporus biennis]|nr:hypothetical protein C8Q75DRAFT_732796 [Abortiporus biennis]